MANLGSDPVRLSMLRYRVDVIVLPKPDLKLLQTTVALVKQRLKQLSTSVPDLMNEALNSKVVSLEGLYYAAIELRNQFGNVLTAATGS